MLIWKCRRSPRRFHLITRSPCAFFSPLPVLRSLFSFPHPCSCCFSFSHSSRFGSSVSLTRNRNTSRRTKDEPKICFIIFMLLHFMCVDNFPRPCPAFPCPALLPPLPALLFIFILVFFLILSFYFGFFTFSWWVFPFTRSSTKFSVIYIFKFCAFLAKLFF